MPPPRRPAPPAEPANPGRERIAKVLARAGLASRRDAEEMVLAGRVSVNGRKLDSPAVTVAPEDRITVDGQPLPQAEPARLWLYHKPPGLVSTARDEQGRPTVLDALPPDLPRVMTIGRLDLNSEGLLLLTNDGGLKRRLELPSTGWLRKYRVRVHGTPTEAQIAPLRAGITVDGERFQPMIVSIDRQQGANAWLTVGLREGRNREVRRAMEDVGLTVNRLIRISYGPFQLGDLAPGAVEEVKARVLRDQLGEGARAADRPTPKARPVAARPGLAKAEAPARAAPVKPAAAKPAPARAAPAEPATGARRSWGMKSHGGSVRAAARPDDGAAEGRTEPAARPRSWGMKSHAGARTAGPGGAGPGKPPRRPDGPPRPKR
jgi:23S rRNA pseudouridine2605 synthase